jgi:hypothetical protein
MYKAGPFAPPGPICGARQNEVLAYLASEFESPLVDARNCDISFLETKIVSVSPRWERKGGFSWTLSTEGVHSFRFGHVPILCSLILMAGYSVLTGLKSPCR